MHNLFPLGGMQIKLTVLDRIILHLYRYRNYDPGSTGDVPEEVTQAGIAGGVDITYTHVPRAVKRLQAEGLLLEVTAHATHKPTGRRRKAYFLTTAGLQVAKRLLSNMAKYTVAFRDKTGVTQEVPLEDINDVLNTREELFTLYTFLSPDNIFDQRAWEIAKSTKARKSSQPAPDTISWSESIHALAVKLGYELLLSPEEYPRIDNFMDREDEIAALKNAINSKAVTIIAVTGPRGIGKSTLVTHTIMDMFYQDPGHEIPVNLFWFDGSEIKTEKQLNAILGQLFCGNGKVKPTTDLLPLAINNLFMSPSQSIVILDGFEHGHLQHIIQIINDKVQENPTVQSKFKLIVITTKTYDPTIITQILSSTAEQTLASTELITVVAVGGLDYKYLKYLLGPGISAAEAQAISHHTDGNPEVVKRIAELYPSKQHELKGLSVEDRSLALVLMAQKMMRI